MIKQFLSNQAAEFFAFRKALSKESDRGCALFAAAYLDKALSDLLYLSLVADKQIDKDLFEGNAPLSSFSSRIKLAFYLGKISKECRKDLDTIRGIRNQFAHHAQIISVDDQSIADRCRNLQFSYHDRAHRPRGHFTAAASRILAILQTTGLKSIAPAVKPDDRPTGADKEQARTLSIQELTERLQKDSSAGT